MCNSEIIKTQEGGDQLSCFIPETRRVGGFYVFDCGFSSDGMNICWMAAITIRGWQGGCLAV